MDITEIQVHLREFANERDWQQFHSAKNLSMALAGEVGELLAIFQWLSEAESNDVMQNPKLAAATCEEIADILIYAIRLADVLHIDLEKSVLTKLRTNAEKYPVAASKGSALKYTDLGKA